MESATNKALETIGLSPSIPGKVNSWKTTEESSSDKLSSCDGHYEVIEYDLNESIDEDGDLLPEISIHKDSPAAAALRANAGVKVPAVSKAARAVHLQSVSRAVRLGSHSSTRKGKPPRAPPPNSQSFVGKAGLDDESRITEEDPELVCDGEEETPAEVAEGAFPAVPPTTILPEMPTLENDEEEESEKIEDEGVTAEDPPARKAERVESVPAIHEESLIGGTSFQSDHSPPPPPRTKDTQPMSLAEGESMHFLRDSIAPGTVEAGRKGSYVI